MNVELLKKVAKHIEEEPRRLDMGIFVETGCTWDDAPPCGTIGCIAGWASMLTGIPPDAADDETGAAALDLNTDQARKLFFTGSWPVDFQRRWYDANNSVEESKITLERINHFIKTNGKE